MVTKTLTIKALLYSEIGMEGACKITVMVRCPLGMIIIQSLFLINRWYPKR